MATQRFQIFTPRSQSERTQQALRAAAAQRDLRIEAMTDGRGLLGYRLDVTVTGPPEQVESFHRLFEGDGWSSGGGSDIVGFILNPILSAILGESQRSLASRLRRKKLERQAAEDDGAA